MSIKDLKLVVVGDGSVGKTSMLQCFKDNKYDSTDTAQFLWLFSIDTDYLIEVNMIKLNQPNLPCN